MEPEGSSTGTRTLTLSANLIAATARKTEAAEVFGPTLSAVDLGILVVSVVGATVLHRIRERNGRKTVRGQWLLDASSVGTILIIACLVLSTASHLLSNHLPVAAFESIARSNSLLVTLAFIYCAVIIMENLRASVQPEATI